MDDLISRKALREAVYHEAFEMDSDMQKLDSGCWIRYKMFENHLKDISSVPAVPLDKLCEFLADTLHTPAPCFNNEEICPRMDFGYCRLLDAPDVKECWNKILTKWMEGLDAAD